MVRAETVTRDTMSVCRWFRRCGLRVFPIRAPDVEQKLCVGGVFADRGAGQRPLLQLSSVLHGVSGQSGLALHTVEPLGQQQPRPSARIATASALQSLSQESPAAVGPGAVPQVGFLASL